MSRALPYTGILEKSQRGGPDWGEAGWSAGTTAGWAGPEGPLEVT